ncbi:hypothetical protein C8F04DRAFT_1304655 [Mycena alexandri]|uniref:Uncharacterized protein n=1 Tax=Mycena alexandri TaxID=1745969 RepID=A0AAD6S9M2_9AGAR|nr:hypothetical protein C8F04DRAFT_1304655 [Mycena alexandri]
MEGEREEVETEAEAGWQPIKRVRRGNREGNGHRREEWEVRVETTQLYRGAHFDCACAGGGVCNKCGWAQRRGGGEMGANCGFVGASWCCGWVDAELEAKAGQRMQTWTRGATWGLLEIRVRGLTSASRCRAFTFGTRHWLIAAAPGGIMRTGLLMGACVRGQGPTRGAELSVKQVGGEGRKGMWLKVATYIAIWLQATASNGPSSMFSVEIEVEFGTAPEPTRQPRINQSTKIDIDITLSTEVVGPSVNVHIRLSRLGHERCERCENVNLEEGETVFDPKITVTGTLADTFRIFGDGLEGDTTAPDTMPGIEPDEQPIVHQQNVSRLGRSGEVWRQTIRRATSPQYGMATE